MLKVMRDSFQHLKWILVFVILMFVLLIFVDWGAGGAPGQTSGLGDAVVAQVNGEAIGAQEFDRALYYMERNYEQLYRQKLTPEMIAQLGLPQQVLNTLIDQRLLLREAERLGLTATPEEVRKRILEIEVLNPEGKFVGAELYETYVKTTLGYSSAADFEARIAEEVTLTKLESALASSVVIDNAAIEAEYRKRNESAKISYIIAAADRLTNQVSVTPAEVEAFYKTSSQRYMHGEQKRLKYLLGDTARIRSQITIPDSALQAAYDKSKEDYKRGESVRARHILIKIDGDTPEAKLAAKAKANELVVKLRGGADFATLAKENSADPGSAAQGGDLGFFERGRMVAPFENAAFSQPIGQISDPVETQFGYHIIETTEKSAGGYRSLAEVRSEIEQRLANERAREQATEQIARARLRVNAMKTKSEEGFRAIANESVSFNDSGFFAKGDPIPGLPTSTALTDWLDKAKSGDVSEVIETPRGPVIAWFSETRASGVTPLAEVRDRVENDVRMQKARELARQNLATAMGAGFDAAATSLGLTPAEVSVSRSGYVSGFSGNITPLIDAALASTAGETKGPVVVDQGAVAFRVLEIKKFDPAAFQTERESLRDTMRLGEMRKLRASLLSARRKEANVVTNDDLLARFTKSAGSARG